MKETKELTTNKKDQLPMIQVIFFYRKGPT